MSNLYNVAYIVAVLKRKKWRRLHGSITVFIPLIRPLILILSEVDLKKISVQRKNTHIQT